ncbi:MAG: carboxylesterase/lipase family protein [Promethearchaeota archaeon]|jgi:para-nitrobenzyl esterase
MEKSNIVKTKTGKIQGYQENGLQIFKGIPFAEPTIGNLRFSPPVKKQSWEGVHDTIKYGPCSFQGHSELEQYLGKLEPESEDCLTLNIWTPGLDNKQRAVMFWIHGGAFMMGGGTDPMYNGSALALRGEIVVVTINYRLGSFGFLYSKKIPPNVGFQDQLMALKWVNENIASFGGDPANVTIFGESAGGYSVLALCTLSEARDLFRRVIAQSAPYIDTKVSDKTSKNIMHKLSIKQGDIDSLREVPPEKIIEAQNQVVASIPTDIMALRPLIIGDTFPKHPLKAFQSGECKDIDFMIGTNLDEFKLYTAMEPFKSMVGSDAEKLIVGYLAMNGIETKIGEGIIKTYKEAREGKYSTEINDILTAIINDYAFRIRTIRLLEAQRPHQPNTFNYMFTWPSSGLGGILGACHSLEIPFVFGTLNSPTLKDFVEGAPEELSEKMMDAWISFAKTGDPNHGNIPKWPAYDVKKRATMTFGEKCKIEEALFDKERKAWDGLLEI